MGLNYVEVAISDGPGTLVNHYVLVNADGWALPHLYAPSVIAILTEDEYQEFIQIHGSERAV